jgi:hypothetical protein
MGWGYLEIFFSRNAEPDSQDTLSQKSSDLHESFLK